MYGTPTLQIKLIPSEILLLIINLLAHAASNTAYSTSGCMHIGVKDEYHTEKVCRVHPNNLNRMSSASLHGQDG